MKKCPHCAESDLQDDAKVCKHCGRALEEEKKKVGCLTALLVVGVGMFLSLSVATWMSPTTGSTPGGRETGRYTQTWKKPYGETTCADWTDSMNNHQRFVAAADMHIKLDKPETLQDSRIEVVKRAITTVCSDKEARSQLITSVMIVIHLGTQ